MSFEAVLSLLEPAMTEYGTTIFPVVSAEIQRKYNEVSTELADTKEMLINARQRKCDYKQEKIELTKKLADVVRAKQDISDVYELTTEINNKLEDKDSLHIRIIKELDAKIAELKKEAADYQSRWQCENEALEAAWCSAERYVTEIKTIKEQNASKDATIKKLNGKLAFYGSEIDALNKHNAELNQEIVSKDSTIKFLQEHIAELIYGRKFRQGIHEIDQEELEKYKKLYSDLLAANKRDAQQKANVLIGGAF
jgi:chromosome segregation ATPase